MHPHTCTHPPIHTVLRPGVQPMDLGTMAKKLARGKYSHPAEVHADIKLVRQQQKQQLQPRQQQQIVSAAAASAAAGRQQPLAPPSYQRHQRAGRCRRLRTSGTRGRAAAHALAGLRAAQVFGNCRLYNEPSAPIVADLAVVERAWVRAWQAAGVYSTPDGLAMRQAAPQRAKQVDWREAARKARACHRRWRRQRGLGCAVCRLTGRCTSY